MRKLLRLLAVQLLLRLLDAASACRPCPRIRPTMRSGWNGSNASGFSPIPINLIGCPVTCRIDSAAPPRASPSIFVSTTPVSRQPLVELLRRLHRVLPGHRIGDKQDLLRVEQLLQPLHLAHQVFINMQTARRIDDQRVAAEVAASRRASFASRSTSAVPAASPFSVAFIDWRSIDFATTFSCSRAAGRYTSTDTSMGRCPPFFSHAASLPPKSSSCPNPASPAIRITVGGCDANLNRAVSLPRSVNQLIVHDLDDLLGRRQRRHHLACPPPWRGCARPAPSPHSG